jgi:aminopeptidase-like protein
MGRHAMNERAVPGTTLRDCQRELDPAAGGREMHALIASLYPICRSLTGPGVRETLAVLKGQIPLEVREVPTGTRMLDWTVPREWTIRDAYIKNAAGDRVVDFRRSNLHVVGYSVPVHRRLSLAELRPHLHSLPEHPDWIPYRTSYYNEDWGFCLAHRQLESLPEGEYEVRIDGSLEDGHLTYGEYHLPGEREDEVLISTHLCHPSLCNDNLSGVAVATALARLLCGARLRYSYRFLFVPATLGPIAWLAQHPDAATRIRHGLVLACVGDRGPVTYKRSRRGDATIDRAVGHVLHHAGAAGRIVPFSPWGYDERQYCSPGFNLPVGCLMRTPHGRFPEYHTSADNLDFVDPAALADTLALCVQALAVLEGDAAYRNRNPYGEPQLGRRGLFDRAAGRALGPARELALLWVLNYSDGAHTLLDIAELSGMPFDAIREAADRLAASDLLELVG